MKDEIKKKKSLVGWITKSWKKTFKVFEFVEIYENLNDISKKDYKDYKKVHIIIEDIK